MFASRAWGDLFGGREGYPALVAGEKLHRAVAYWIAYAELILARGRK